MGGEDHGHFAAIKLDGPRSAADVDSALPMAEHWRSGSGSSTNGDGIRRAANVKVERIGKEIVNSISIHRIQDEEAHLDDIVAVLANNDKTVRLYSLPAGQETRVKTLPYPMNHATISPDGRTMVAVGDFNKAYFFTRDILISAPLIHKPHNRLTSAHVEWNLTNVISLYVSSPSAPIGFFTTAWSPSGRLVAVGSESGYITVFDRDLLDNPDCEDNDAIVATVQGTRADLPFPHPGAVRSMVFSPEPWDLLVWAEDHGRVCIGDLRTGLKCRQIINLEPKEEGLKKLTFEELPADENVDMEHLEDMEADFIRRFRSAPDSTTAINFATEYVEARRRQEEQRQERTNIENRIAATLEVEGYTPGSEMGLENDSQGLTAREQLILESLRTTRQREEARANGQIPRSVNYTSPDLFVNSGARSSSSSSAAMNTPESTRGASDTMSRIHESFAEFSRTYISGSAQSSASAANDASALPPFHTLQDRIWGSAGARAAQSRLSDASRLPRRRASVVLNPPSLPTSASALADTGSGAPSDPITSLNLTATHDQNPWRLLEDEISPAGQGPLFEFASRAQAASPLPATDRPTTTDAQQDMDAQRARQAIQQRQRDRLRHLRAEGLTPTATTSAQATGDRTILSLNEARRLANFPGGYETLIARNQFRGFEVREFRVRTAGLAMSADGRTLWAACEDGIFEVSMHIKGRMFWPALDPR